MLSGKLSFDGDRRPTWRQLRLEHRARAGAQAGQMGQPAASRVVVRVSAARLLIAVAGRRTLLGLARVQAFELPL